MIERHVYLKLSEPSDESRGEIRESARTILSGIPGVLGVRTGIAADDLSSKSWDVVLVVRFASIEDYEPYRDHPEHRRFVDKVVAPRAAARKAWNFEIEE